MVLLSGSPLKLPPFSWVVNEPHGDERSISTPVKLVRQLATLS